MHSITNSLASQKAAPELLFRSISLVLADNARAEYAFVSSFFGQPEDVSHPSSDSLGVEWNRHLGSDRSPGLGGSSALSSAHDDDTASVISEGVSFATSAGGGGSGIDRGERMKKHVVEHVWKQVYEPTLEYAKVRSELNHSARALLTHRPQNFIVTLLSSSSPSLLSILSMIRENDSLSDTLIGEHKSGDCPTTSMESYFIGVKMQLWPLFQKEMGINIDSVKKLTDGAGSGGMTAFMTGGRNAAVKDSVVAAVCLTKRHRCILLTR